MRLRERSVSITVRFNDTEALKEQGATTRPHAAEIHLTPEEFRDFFADGALMALDDSPSAETLIWSDQERHSSLYAWTAGVHESATQIIRSLTTEQEN